MNVGVHPRPHVRLVLAILLPLLFVVGTVSADAARDPDSAGSAASKLCQIAKYEDVVSSLGVHTAEGHYAYQDWIARPEARPGAERLNAAVAAQFGSADADDSLGAGLIGVAVDHLRRSLVVVVDPAAVSITALRGRLQASAAGVSVRVQAGCFSAKQLVAARDILQGRSWHAKAPDATYSFYLDAFDSTYHASFNPGDELAAAELEARLGPLVAVDFEGASRLGRLDDGEPHWGGAGIRPGSNSNNICTSAFTVRIPNGNLGSVTAGHCFRLTGNGDINGRNVYSGPQFYGETAGSSGYPTFDMVRIHPSGESFDNRIHVDPCCPVVRTVVSSGNPGVADPICVSGMVTRALCGLEVTTLNATLCDASGCTPNLIRATRGGDVVARGGDSGGPMYNRIGDTQAAARGMIVGGPLSGTAVLGHRIGTVTSHLNVNVSTS